MTAVVLAAAPVAAKEAAAAEVEKGGRSDNAEKEKVEEILRNYEQIINNTNITILSTSNPVGGVRTCLQNHRQIISPAHVFSTSKLESVNCSLQKTIHHAVLCPLPAK